MSSTPSMKKRDANSSVSDATPKSGCIHRYPPMKMYARPTSAFQIMLPAPWAWNATTRWMTPARMMSQAMTALTVTAARSGDPTARIPNRISRTPQRIAQPEACRNNEPGDGVTICASLDEFQEAHFATGVGFAQGGRLPEFPVDGLLLPRYRLQTLGVKLEEMSGIFFRLGGGPGPLETYP